MDFLDYTSFHPGYSCAAARTRLHFLCLPKESEAKEMAPQRLALRCAAGSLRSSVKTGAAELAPCGRADSPRFSRFCLPVLGCVEGGWGLRSTLRYGLDDSPIQAIGTLATSSRPATQKPPGASEGCLSDRRERVPERGRIRVAQGSPGTAGAGLLEQMLLVTFGETKVTKNTNLETRN